MTRSLEPSNADWDVYVEVFTGRPFLHWADGGRRVRQGYGGRP
jgi:hypothetical protein